MKTECALLSEMLVLLRKNERDMTKNVYWSSCKVKILMKLEFSRQIFRKILQYQTS